MNYRLYTFNHVWLSSLQKGLQTAHVVSELFVDYPPSRVSICTDEAAVQKWRKKHKRRDALENWAHDDKTIIMLSGGNSRMLDDWHTDIMTWQRVEDASTDEILGVFMPFTCFHEDAESLNNSITSVGVVLPEEIWGAQVKPSGVLKTVLGEVNLITVSFPSGLFVELRTDEEPPLLNELSELASCQTFGNNITGEPTPPLFSLIMRAWFVVKLKRFQMAI